MGMVAPLGGRADEPGTMFKPAAHTVASEVWRDGKSRASTMSAMGGASQWLHRHAELGGFRHLGGDRRGAA